MKTPTAKLNFHQILLFRMHANNMRKQSLYKTLPCADNSSIQRVIRPTDTNSTLRPLLSLGIARLAVNNRR